MRNFPGQSTRDQGSISNLTYNENAGAQKNTEVGRKLLPLGDGAGDYTTDASTARKLPSKGRNLAIYNNSAAVHAVTTGTNSPTLTAKSAGAVLSGSAGQSVGIPIPPAAWFFIACGEHDYVITDSNTLLVYLIDDSTSIK